MSFAVNRQPKTASTDSVTLRGLKGDGLGADTPSSDNDSEALIGSDVEESALEGAFVPDFVLVTDDTEPVLGVVGDLYVILGRSRTSRPAYSGNSCVKRR